MKTRFPFLLSMGALSLGLLSSSAWPLAGNGAERPEIVLGQSASFSGSFASQAVSYRDGAQAYFSKINAEGGVHGRRIRLVSLDDGYKVDKAVDNTNQLLVNHDVLALFGYTWTNTVRATLPLAEASGTPMFAPYTGYEELYTRFSPVLFTTRASFSDELARILLHMRTIGLTRIGLLHYESPSGMELLGETRTRLGAMGLGLLGVATMKVGSRDPGAAVQALQKTDLQALIIGASGSDAVAFVREFEAVRPRRLQYYARSLIGFKQLISELGPLSTGISISQTAPNPLRHTPVAVEYRHLLGQFMPDATPDYMGLEGMIAAKVLVEALRRAGPTADKRRLVQALERMSTYDLGGYTVRFGPQRHHGSRFVDITMIGRDGRIVD